MLRIEYFADDSDDPVSTGNQFPIREFQNTPQELPDDLVDRVLDQIKKIMALDLSSASYSGPESLELEVRRPCVMIPY